MADYTFKWFPSALASEDDKGSGTNQESNASGIMRPETSSEATTESLPVRAIRSIANGFTGGKEEARRVLDSSGSLTDTEAARERAAAAWASITLPESRFSVQTGQMSDYVDTFKQDMQTNPVGDTETVRPQMRPEQVSDTVAPTESLRPQPRPVNSATSPTGSEALLSFIAKGEGSYDSSNRGTKGSRIIGSTHATSRSGKKLSEMTIGEIRALQEIKDPDNKDRLFAVGKYQLIPDTMAMAIESLGLSDDQVFDSNTQEQLGMWLLMDKRPDLGGYIRGEHNDLNRALTAAAKEWASLPDPETGKSYYGSGNRAQHSIEATTKALQDAREAFLKEE